MGDIVAVECLYLCCLVLRHVILRDKQSISVFNLLQDPLFMRHSTPRLLRLVLLTLDDHQFLHHIIRTEGSVRQRADNLILRTRKDIPILNLCYIDARKST